MAVTGLDKIGNSTSDFETESYNVKTTNDSRYQDYMLESIIPAEEDMTVVDEDTAIRTYFRVKVTPRNGATPSNGNLYFKLTSTYTAYTGSYDVSFNGTAGRKNDIYVSRPSGMPYVAGRRGEGKSVVFAVAKITSSGATLEVEIYGAKRDDADKLDSIKSAIVDFAKATTVEYAWVDEVEAEPDSYATSYTDGFSILYKPANVTTVTGLDKVGTKELGTGSYNVKATTDSRYQDYKLESIIPAKTDHITDSAVFKIKVTPRTGKLPTSGNLYFKLTSAYAGDKDISFNGTVYPNDTGVFSPRPAGMHYVAGTHGEGLAYTATVAEITPSGATLEVGILGNDADITEALMVEFMQAISVEYAWVDEAV